MSSENQSEEISTFGEFWRFHTRPSVSGERVRTNLREFFIHLKNTIEQSRYDHEDVIEAAEYIEEDYSDFSSTTFESVCPDLIDDLRQQILEALDADRNREDETLFSLFRELEPLESVEGEITEAGFDFNDLKSDVCREVKKTSRRKKKSNLSLYELRDELSEVIDLLDSAKFKKEYNEALVSIIESYLRNGEGTPENIKQITKELVGELQSRGWGEDSFDEVRKCIKRSGDTSKILKYLRLSEIGRRYCVPLPENTIPKSPISAGGVEFYSESDSEFDFFEELRESSGAGPEATKFITRDTDLFAVIEVAAVTNELGQQKMENKLERAIDAMNTNQKTGVLRSPFLQPQTKYLLRLEDGSYRSRVSNHSKYGLPHDFRIRDVEKWEQAIRGFDFFDKPKKDRSELESRFVQSFRWYGDAIQSGIPEDELLKYVIAMESMLVPEVNTNTRKVLANRLMNLGGIYEQYREGYQLEVDSLYELRNNIVHNAEKNSENLDSQIDSARMKATNMYVTISHNYIGEVDTINDLLEKLEESEVPTAPDDYHPFRV